MERDPYLGRLVTGRIFSGVVRVGDRVHGLKTQDGISQVVESGKVRFDTL
jgi:GTP-binding protein